MSARPLAVVLLLSAFACQGAAAGEADPAPAAPQNVPAPAVLALPGTNWHVEVPIAGFTIEQQGAKEDGRAYLLARGPAGQTLSVTIERAKTPPPSTACRDYNASRSARDKQSIPGVAIKDSATSVEAGWDLVEYDLVLEGKPRFYTLYGCRTRSDAYVDAHFSEFPATGKAVRESFHGMLARIAIVDAPAAAAPKLDPEIEALCREGFGHYLEKDYAAALKPLQKALDLEKEHRTLSRELWVTLVDNLSIAYGITGDFARSRATLEYGLQQDPTCPTFAYNLACTLAETGDKKGAMEALQKAFDNRAKSIPGERLADPRTDSSFTALMKDPEFKALAEKLAALR